MNRQIALDGGINFRDLGGYSGADGREVKWNKLYRCGHLANLSPLDLQQLEQMNITQVHDFRRREEQDRNPTRAFAAEFFADYEMFIGSMSKFWEYMQTQALNAQTAHQLVVGSYGSCMDEVAPHYNRLFQSLLNNRNNATLFHCAAGKDRTGIAAALILSALGVSREQIIDDYMLTMEYYDVDALIQVVEQHLRNADVDYWEREWLLPYCGVHRDNMIAFFEGVEQGFGSMDNYLEVKLGMGKENREDLRQHYLD